MTIYNAKKLGFLNDKYRMFYLIDNEFPVTTEYHYHEFYKVVLFLSGKVTYLIEGKSYCLEPWDILLIKNHEIHRSIMEKNCSYERYILWIRSDFFEESNEFQNLLHCFQSTSKRKNHLLRLNPSQRITLYATLEYFKHSESHRNEFGSGLYAYSVFLQIMVLLNRFSLTQDETSLVSHVTSNATVDRIIDYVNQHINKDLSIQAIADQMYLSASYLQHQFREITGTSLHVYINQKRLAHAIDLINRGTPPSNASALSGYQAYSTFIRNFKKNYHCTPKEYLNQRKEEFQGKSYRE